MEKWIETRKSGNFTEIGKRHGIDPVIARIMRNRDISTDDQIEEYLHGGIEHLNDPHLLKDADRAAAIIREKIAEGKKIRIIGDYDIDGVNATYILLKALRRCGADVDYAIPDRVRDGYGINEHLIECAYEDQIDTIITCDNGIAARDAIALAKEKQMTVIVTDHHDIPYVMVDGQKQYQIPEADAVINPKQADCPYPYKELCGAVVAFKLVQILYENTDYDVMEFLENAAFATVGDVMNLTGENRILVKEGLKAIHTTKSPGLLALILQNELVPENIATYHLGYVLGPCMNASGRLDTAEAAVELLLSEEDAVASGYARRLIELNAERKNLTTENYELAVAQIEEHHWDKDRVMVVYLPECHESLAGIIAGRIRERYYRPVFVLTKSEDGVKGSGRSIEEYSMYEEMNKIADIFTRFGGHPMAAGLSLAGEEKVDEFRRRLNEQCSLTEDDLTEKIRIDVPVPISYVSLPLITQLAVLEPCGKGNSKPVFADRKIHIREARIVGKNRNVLKLVLAGEHISQMDAVYFGDIEVFLNYFREKFGEDQVDAMLHGKTNRIEMAMIYDMAVNDYQGRQSPQIIVRRYR
ncbi:MAG: single-stranded-DNA-specific exonuclease RecJ [Lachnospiraceae bacterium]|nr:single-stranded-DNA-specific exonuclease RecJ [Lachnospiraceae bacterium]